MFDKKSKSKDQIVEQLEAHGIEFGEKYSDPASGFVGEVQSMYFYKHGCLRVELRGKSAHSGEPASYAFDAPDLVKVATAEPVPAGKRTGGPHDLTVAPR